MNRSLARAMKTLCLAVPLLFASSFLLTGCAGTHQARGVKTSGFLDDYSQLEKGKGDQALLRYVKPGVDFAKYKAVLVDPIQAYPGEADGSLAKLEQEELKKLLDYLDASVRKELAPDYRFVDAPGEDVLRLRFAITDASPGNRAVDTVSTIVPWGLAASGISSLATGKGLGVGETTIEFEAVDSVTGERIAAAVDRRIGDKFTGQFDKMDAWREAEAAFDSWALLLKTRMAEMRAGQK
jgi:hypothetical protein